VQLVPIHITPGNGKKEIAQLRTTSVGFLVDSPMHEYSSSLLQPIFYKPIAFCEILQKVLISIIFHVNYEMLERLEELGIQR
jgi:hypothetical protein